MVRIEIFGQGNGCIEKKFTVSRENFSAVVSGFLHVIRESTAPQIVHV